MTELLIAKSPKLLDAVNNNGWTALHSAAYNGHEKVTELLIAKSPKLLDAVDNDGFTALHFASRNGHEKVTEFLIAKHPKLLDAVNNNGHTALHLAAENGHKKVLGTISKAMQILALQLKNLKAEENKTANKSGQEDKKFHYSHEKIHKLLSVQLQNEKNVNIEMLDLTNLAKSSISEQQLQNFVDSVVKGNKILAIALHLHGEAWASLIIKHIGENNLQLIYNDSTGNAFSKEPAVRELINSLTEQNQNGDTLTTDLRQIQQNIESDSGAIAVDNLVRLATAKNFKKADLQKLLLKAQQVNELKTKHLLIDDTSPDYSEHKLTKLLELSLKDKPITIAPINSFEDGSLLFVNTKNAGGRVENFNVTTVMPLFTQGNCWAGLVIKKQDGTLQVIYDNPTGGALRDEKNHPEILKAFLATSLDVRIIDVSFKQIGDNKSSGAFTVNNLIKLALNNTSDFYKENFQKLLSTFENIDQLRQQHDKLIHDYVMPNLTLEAELSVLTIGGGEREPFKQKGDWSEGKEEYAAPPSYQDEDNPVQIHVLGENTEC